MPSSFILSALCFNPQPGCAYEEANRRLQVLITSTRVGQCHSYKRLYTMKPLEVSTSLSLHGPILRCSVNLAILPRTRFNAHLLVKADATTASRSAVSRKAVFQPSSACTGRCYFSSCPLQLHLSRDLYSQETSPEYSHGSAKTGQISLSRDERSSFAP